MVAMPFFRFSSYNCPMAISETDLHDPYTFLNEYILRKADSTKRFFDKHLFGLSFRNVSASSRGFFIDTWYTNQVRFFMICFLLDM